MRMHGHDPGATNAPAVNNAATAIDSGHAATPLGVGALDHISAGRSSMTRLGDAPIDSA